MQVNRRLCQFMLLRQHRYQNRLQRADNGDSDAFDSAQSGQGSAQPGKLIVLQLNSLTLLQDRMAALLA